MKVNLLNINGEKQEEIDLPKIFSSKIRLDIVKKVYDAERIWQPYGNDPEAGKKQSASGVIRHKRHSWKAHYGRGISRIPRKTMWRRGTQFYWIGAEISSARGGRRAHGPKKYIPNKKINKKERKIAFESAIASTINKNLILKRYSNLSEVKNHLPLIVNSKIYELKTKELINSIEKILEDLKIISKKEKSIRSGKGKSRNRKYKKSAGVLIITGNNEKLKTKIFDQVKVNGLKVSYLYPLGRIVIYTENAIKDLEDMEKIKK